MRNGHLRPEMTRIRLSTSAAAVLSRRLGLRITGGTSYQAYQLLNSADYKCLDADDAGTDPLAGQNGDKVQLWNCRGTSATNQMWIPISYDVNGSAWTALVNGMYQTECLNANSNGGLHDGSLAQLYNCGVGGGNMIWDEGTVIQQYPSPDYLTVDESNAGGAFVLDANASDISNDGDTVQIWHPLGTSNQWWWS